MNAAREVPVSRTLRPFYWSVRRELWEHRSIYKAPIIVAAVALVGLIIASASLPSTLRRLSSMPLDRQLDAMSMPYSIAALLPMLTSIIVGCLYCVDAMQGERRDRSILFWKSLPVSDATTVLAKVAIPLVVLPILAFVTGTVVQLVLVLVSSVVTLANGFALSELWSRLPWTAMPVGFLYFVLSMALWYAPIYAWCLFVSAWAKRGAFVWAVVPPLAILAIGSTAFQSSVVTSFIKSRLVGGFSRAFSTRDLSAVKLAPGDRAGEVIPDPTRFLTSPELWIGLIIAALLVFAAIRLRRRREPLSVD